MKKSHLYLWLLIALVPCCILRDFTPDNELRYLSIADEALRDGHLFAFYNHGEPYADKPPLFLWGVTLCRWLAGSHCMALLSLLTLLPAWGVLHVADRWLRDYGLAETDRTTAVLLLATCGFFPAMALCIRPDMLMGLFIMLALDQAWRYIGSGGQEKRQIWLFALWVFMGIFSKGVVGLIMPLATTLIFLALTRRLRMAAGLWGWRTWLTLAAGCGTWFALVWNEGGTAYLDNLLVHQTVDRAVNAFTHRQPFYYYLIAATYVLAPWTLLLLWRMGHGLKAWRETPELHKFLLSGILSTVAVLSLSSSKLAVYLLPVIPLCTTLAMLDFARYRDTAAARFCIGAPAVILCAAFPAAIGYAFITDGVTAAQWGLYAGALALSLCAVAALAALTRRKDAPKALRLQAAGLMLALFFGGCSLGALNSEIGYGPLSADALRVAEKTGIGRFGSFRMRRVENIDVYLHQVPREIGEEELAAGTLRRTLVLSPRRKRLAADSLFEGRKIIASGKYDIIVFE